MQAGSGARLFSSSHALALSLPKWQLQGLFQYCLQNRSQIHNEIEIFIVTRFRGTHQFYRYIGLSFSAATRSRLKLLLQQVQVTVFSSS